MKVLYVSKASVVAAYQDKLGALAEHARVEAVIPARWGSTRGEAMAAGGARIRTGRVWLHGHNHLHMYVGARSIVRTARPDIAHLDEEPYSAATFQFARLCARARVPFLFFAWQNIDKPIPPPFGAMRRYVLAHAAAGIAGSERAAEVLRAAGFTREIAVIPQLGVDPGRFSPDRSARAEVRRSLGIAESDFVAGFAGRLVPEKGADLLIDAVAATPRTRVLIVGDGPERAQLERRAEEAGIAARTRFAGPIDSLEMPRWLNAFDVLVLPSRTTRTWMEQFGRVLIEAMACGVPVIGAASGEIPRVIGAAGLTFPEGDTAMLVARLIELSNAPAFRAKLAARGREHVLARFTQQRIAHDTVALYDRVLSNGTNGTHA